MNRYKKNGKIKSQKDITIHKDGMVTYNPTEEMIIADGWKEYIPPTPTAVQQLSTAKKRKKNEIEVEFDNALHNNVTINGTNTKLIPSEVDAMITRVLLESAMNINKTYLRFGNNRYDLKTKDALSVLYDLNTYIVECNETAIAQKDEVNSKTTIEEIDSFTPWYNKKDITLQ